MTWASIWTKWVVPWVLQMAQTMQFYSDVPSLPPLIYLPANVWKWSCSDGAVYECGDTMSPHKHSVCHSAAQSCPTLWPHGLQHTRLLCPSPAPRACSNSCPLSRWCHPAISSSVIPFSSCLQSFPASGSQHQHQWVSSSHQVVKVLELQLQHQSFQWIFRVDFL